MIASFPANSSLFVPTDIFRVEKEVNGSLNMAAPVERFRPGQRSAGYCQQLIDFLNFKIVDSDAGLGYIFFRVVDHEVRSALQI